MLVDHDLSGAKELKTSSTRGCKVDSTSMAGYADFAKANIIVRRAEVRKAVSCNGVSETSGDGNPPHSRQLEYSPSNGTVPLCYWQLSVCFALFVLDFELAPNGWLVVLV